jgi:hypothetical protein
MRTLKLPRARMDEMGKCAQAVKYHHVIHPLRKRPMALLHLTYRSKLFLRQKYRRTFERLLELLSDRQANTLVQTTHQRRAPANLRAS